MGKRTRTIVLLLSIAVLVIPSIACLFGGDGDDWDGLDRSGWAWDGSAGDDPIATAEAIGKEISR